MQTINILDDSLISKIAAGEVIERPASVVKELVENSIDAGSKNIVIAVENDNFDLVVKDDGKGMSYDDTMICLTRHATSKIKDADDLFNIISLGFRGEALASIASVSKMEIISKQTNDDAGVKLKWDGNTQEITKTGSGDGTIISVKDLFYNTPVRRKFLKSAEIELREILDLITRFALYYNNISFRLIKNNKVIFKTNKSENPLQSIIDVYGVDTAKSMIKIEFSDGPIKINGFISKPPVSRSNREAQNIFVNGRNIKDKIITDAVYEGYHSMLFNKRHPIFILNIDIDPKVIDVNVHPTKREIRIKDEKLMHNAISKIINDALTKDTLKEKITKNAFEQQKLSDNGGFERNNKYIVPIKNKEIIIEDINPDEYRIKLEKIEILSKPKPMTRDYRILGQIHKCFILAENNNGLILIDQHTAEERIYYDKFMKQYANQEIKKQSMLKPQIIELNTIDSQILMNNLNLMQSMGFDIEHFGSNTFKVNSIPVIFSRMQDKETIMSIIDELIESNKSKKIESLKEDIITRMSCKAAIKRGDELSTIQMYELLDKLFGSTLPNTCPHGRPIIISYSVDDLEKMFRRK